MTEKIEAMKQLIELIESDNDIQAEAKIYGNWVQHLKDFIADNTTD